MKLVLERNLMMAVDCKFIIVEIITVRFFLKKKIKTLNVSVIENKVQIKEGDKPIVIWS